MKKGKPVAIVNSYSGTDTTYQTVVVWRICQVWELDCGRLNRIFLTSDTPAKTHFRLTVLGKILFKDLITVGSLTLAFPDNELPRGEEIKIETKSTDGTAIVVTTAIAGAEYQKES